MKLDSKKYKEVNVPRVPIIADDERFYAVPNAKDYALSTYGRLFKKTNKSSYNKVKSTFNSKVGEESYNIRFNSKKQEEIISIRKLLAITFFPDMKGIYLINPNFNPFNKYRWRVENLHVLRNKDEILEYILAKIEHREPTYNSVLKGNQFVNRGEYGKPIREVIKNKYWGMYSRATNENVKELYPQYKNTTTEFISPEEFYQWYLDSDYFYPGAKSLDKDILGFGKANCYSKQYAAIVPSYINNIFAENKTGLGYHIIEKENEKGRKYYKIPKDAYWHKKKPTDNAYYDTYIQALHAGRKRKADYIRAVVLDEREKGFMPDNILEAMEKWANLCELGLVEIWEPSEETLKSMNIL